MASSLRITSPRSMVLNRRIFRLWAPNYGPRAVPEPLELGVLPGYCRGALFCIVISFGPLVLFRAFNACVLSVNFKIVCAFGGFKDWRGFWNSGIHCTRVWRSPSSIGTILAPASSKLHWSADDSQSPLSFRSWGMALPSNSCQLNTQPRECRHMVNGVHPARSRRLPPIVITLHRPVPYDFLCILIIFL